MEHLGLLSTAIAEHLGVELRGEDLSVNCVTPLGEPVDGGLTFCTELSIDLLQAWDGIKGIVIAPPGAPVPNSCAHLVSMNPRADYARMARGLLAPPRSGGVSPTSRIHETVVMGDEVSIGHNVVVEAGVVIGDRVTIGHNSTILRDSIIGNDVAIGHNTVIGSVGFGLEDEGNGEWVRIPHLGHVVLEDNVEIGSSTVIARGTIRETRISRNCKVDDNVFIAHNVMIGPNTVVIANAEISGSVRIGSDCWIGPSVTILEKITVETKAMVGIGSVVIRDVPSGKVVVGNPAKVLRDR